MSNPNAHTRRVREIKKSFQRTDEQKQRKGKGHRFIIFRMGTDICGTCGRPRSEHER